MCNLICISHGIKSTCSQTQRNIRIRLLAIHRNHHIFITLKSRSHSQAIELIGVVFNRITPLHPKKKKNPLHHLCEFQVSLLLVTRWCKVTIHSILHVLPRSIGYIMSFLLLSPPNYSCPFEFSLAKRVFTLCLNHTS